MSIFYITGIVLNILAQHKYITESSSHALKGKNKSKQRIKKIETTLQRWFEGIVGR